MHLFPRKKIEKTIHIVMLVCYYGRRTLYSLLLYLLTFVSGNTHISLGMFLDKLASDSIAMATQLPEYTGTENIIQSELDVIWKQEYLLKDNSIHHYPGT